MNALIIIPDLKHGGTNKSTRNILPFFKANNIIVDIFSMYSQGPYRQIFEGQDGIDLWYDNLYVKNPKNVFAKIRGYFFSKYKYIKYQKLISRKNYDIVIAMEEDIATLFAKKIKCKKKIAWVRCDYLQGYGNRNELSIYNSFDTIICVSDFTQSQFLKKYPSLSSKVYSIHNFINKKEICNLSNLSFEKELVFTHEFNVISVGRLHPVKQFSYIPQICSKIKSAGIDIGWIIIGEGPERNTIEANIVKFDVRDNVELFGQVNNPYPYMKRSDLVVCLSKSEACPNCIIEPQILGVPVISTDFGSSKEFIINEKTGIISGIEDIATSIIKLHDDKLLYEKIKSSLFDNQYDNDDTSNKLLEIFHL